MHSPSTRLCNRWYCCGSAGLARLTASAIESAFQYEANAMAAENTRATIARVGPAPMKAPNAAPASESSTTKPVISSALRRLLALIISYMCASS